MVLHYFRVLLKHILRNRMYTVINVAGLALGLACCIVLTLFVLSESGYDEYHEDKKDIYRLTLGVAQLNDGGSYNSPLTSFLWAPALIDDYPEIESYIRVFHISDPLLFRYNETEFQDERFVYADENIFSFFTWPLLQGDPATVLSQPYSVVVSESIAQSYFGDIDPIGRILTTYDPRSESTSNPDGVLELTVTGVMVDIPYKSHLKPSMVASFNTLNDVFNADVTAGVAPAADFWRARNTHTYLKLHTQASVENLEAKFPDFLNRYVGDSTTARGFSYRPYLQGLDTIHLEGPVTDDFDEGGDRDQIYMFAVIAVVILIVACINFTNLTTAQSIIRACEIGIRKATGARRIDLVRQFLGESIFLAILALVLAFAIAELLNPIFYAYIGREFYLPVEDWPLIVIGMCFIAVLVGVMSGVYPAFVMANVKAVDALQTRFAITGKGRYFSKALVTMQFAITIFFIFATFIIYQQRHFMVTHDLGVKTEQIVIFPLFEPDALRQIESIRNELASFPGVQGVTISNGVPGTGRSGDIWGIPGSSDQAVISMEQATVDYDYVELYGLELLAGRNFDITRTTDAAPLEITGPGYEMAAIVNEAAVRSLGFGNPEDAIGTRLVRDPVSNDFTVTIIGVLRNFHATGLQNEISPAVFYIDRHEDPGFRLVSVELTPANIAGSIEHIGNTVAPFLGERTFEYYFLDQYFEDRWYRNEQRLFEIFSYISFLTIFIACMGLLGLATFSAEQRTKEIGIRKVFGATVESIVMLISTDFVKLVVVSAALALPLAYYLMTGWLKGFAYRYEIGPGTFGFSSLLALAVALLTVGSQALRAALRSPLASLKYE